MEKLVIWSNAKFSDELRDKLEKEARPYELAWSPQLEESNLVAGGQCPLLGKADVAFGQPLASQVLGSPRLKWVHLTTAGYTNYDNREFKTTFSGHGGKLTNSSSVYAEPCAQHAAAFLLMQARNMLVCFENQRTSRGWPDSEVRKGSSLLQNQKLVILGFGAIGKRLVELVSPYHLDILAFKRKRTDEKGVKVILEEELGNALMAADHVINILPLNDATRCFVNRERLRLLKPGAVFYNIGRGQTVEQEALVEVLSTRSIRGAYLDVTDPEPLPPEHPLWHLPNCMITPHSAGGFKEENEALVSHFLGNLNRFAAGMPFRDQVC